MKDTDEILVGQLLYSDLSDNMKLISDISGLDFTKTLMLNHGGGQLYIPCLKYVRPLIKRFLKENIKTGSYQELLCLSKDMDVSVEYLSILIREIYTKSSKV
jgi:hypothetical protein